MNDSASESARAPKHLQSRLLMLVVTDTVSGWLTRIICFPSLHVLVDLRDYEMVLSVKLLWNTRSCPYSLVERCGFVLPGAKGTKLAKVWSCHEVQISYCACFLTGKNEGPSHMFRGFFLGAEVCGVCVRSFRSTSDSDPDFTAGLKWVVLWALPNFPGVSLWSCCLFLLNLMRAHRTGWSLKSYVYFSWSLQYCSFAQTAAEMGREWKRGAERH